MKLTQKYLFSTILSITAAALFALLAILLPLYSFEVDTVHELTESRIHTMDAYFGNNVQSLKDKAIEYAYWDDLINALEESNLSWIRDNITEYLYESPFDIDVAYLFSDHHAFYDFFSEDLQIQEISSLTILNQFKEDRQTHVGFSVFHNDLYAFAVSPVTNNIGSLDPVGYLLIGRKIKDDTILLLQDYLGDVISIQLDSKSKNFNNHPIVDNKKTVQFRYYIQDPLARPIAAYDVTLDVRHYYELKHILFRNISFLILLSLFICSVVIYKMTKKLSRQFEEVVGQIKHIGDGNYALKLKEDKTYELQILTESINKLSSNLVEKITKTHDNYLKTIETLIATIEIKDPYTHGHSERVAEYSVILAKKVGFYDIDSIKIAALMHDIGKIGIPESVLNKPGFLTEAEMLQIRQHPEKGFIILDKLDDFQDIKYMILYHHEWYNGRGYPHKLSGEHIPPGARIIAVADAFDAMTSNRSYRNALTVEDAWKEINHKKGVQFDPEIVDAFNEALDEFIHTYNKDNAPRIHVSDEQIS